MFAKFFKPRWQHSKATVRVQAINRLSPEKAEHLEVLSQLARQDQSAEVRQAAVERLVLPELLTEILEKDADPGIRRSAAQRLCKLILDDECPASQRISCVSRLRDDNILAHIALNCEDRSIQMEAVANIEDQHCLTTLTINGSTSQLRQRAAEKLELPELLTQASKAIKGKDKSVFRIIRTKQQQIQDQARLTEQLKQRQLELINSLQHLAATEYFPQYAAKYDALLLQLNDSLLPELSESFHQAQQQCLAVLEAEQQRITLAQQKKQQQAELQRLQDQLIDQMNTAAERCESLLRTAHFNGLDLDAEQQHWLSLVEQWETHSRELPSKASISVIKRQQSTLATAQRWLDHQAAITPLIEQIQRSEEDSSKPLLKTAQQLCKEINWPAEIPAPQELQDLKQCIQSLQSQVNEINLQTRSESDNLAQLLSQLEIRLNAGEIKLASRLEQKAAELLQGMNGSTPSQLQHQYRSLHAQLHEMLDWQGYAVVPKKEQLCTAMEALAETPQDPAELARNIKELQKQWKKLDANDPYHSHALWQRFKDASDIAYKPCEAYFAEQKQQREENLANRKQLVAELQAFLTDTNWENPDWQAIEQHTRNAKQQWKHYAPVDRTPGKEVQSQFNALLKQMDNRIKQRREQVAELKKEFLAQARDLLPKTETISHGDLENAAEQIKTLQQQWKQVGSTFHSLERTLWPEFKEACNQVFTALNQHKQTQRHQHNRQQQELESFLDSDSYKGLQRRINLCDQMEGMLLDGTLDQLALDEFQSAWNQGEYPEPPFDELIDYRYQNLLALIAGRIEMEQLTEITDQALRQLCIRLEIVLGVESPEQDQALRMEYQMQRLQSALQQQNQDASLLEMKHLELEWQCQPFAQHHEALQLRFYSKLQLN